MPAADNGLGEIEELRKRLSDVEAALASLKQRESGFRTPEAETFQPSRRSLLGLLAGAGAVSMLGNAGFANGAEPVDAALGAWKTYSPQLKGEKEDPLVGIDEGPGYKRGGRNGHYWQYGKTVLVKTWIQFGRGMKPGLGEFRLSIPVKAALGSDCWLGPTGMAIMHSDATNLNRNASVILAHSDFVVLQVDNMVENVGHDNPWKWAQFDGFNTFMLYEAAE